MPCEVDYDEFPIIHTLARSVDRRRLKMVTAVVLFARIRMYPHDHAEQVVWAETGG